MLKKMFAIILGVLYLTVICSCSKTGLPKQTGSDGNKLTQLDVVRYPLLDGAGDYDYSKYYESGLQYLERSEILDKDLNGVSKKVVINNREYVATYCRSMVYSDDKSKFLKHGNYDEYIANGKMDIEVFKESGFIKKVYVHKSEQDTSEQIVSEFSESGLKDTAESVLTNLYGSSISEYLKSYYQFEYAKLMEYENAEQNRYVVSYRAYLNDIPTDDVLYVQFTLTGSLLSVSAQRYLQYLHADEASLATVSDLTELIKGALNKLDYSKIDLRETEVPCYYTMNSEGKLYYVMEWEAFKAYTEDTGVTCVEVLAIPATKA